MPSSTLPIKSLAIVLPEILDSLVESNFLVPSEKRDP